MGVGAVAEARIANRESRFAGSLPAGGGLEEFDNVAGGVFDEDLGAAGTAHDVVAERANCKVNRKRIASFGDR